MTPLAWTISVVAPIVGVALGRLSKRKPAPVPALEDPRLEFERQRADRAEEKTAAQESELRDWAASHKVLEAQVTELREQLAAAETSAAQPESPAASSGSDDAVVSELKAKVAQLEGRIAAGAGAVTRDDVVEAARIEERIMVLTGDLARANGKIAELERRLDPR